MKRAVTMLGAALMSLACASAPTGPTPLGGVAGAALCDPQSQTSLPAVVTQLEALDETDDPTALVSALDGTLATMQEMQLESGSEIATWRDASVDAVQQLQRRIGEPERRSALVEHAALTMGLFEDRLCASDQPT